MFTVSPEDPSGGGTERHNEIYATAKSLAKDRYSKILPGLPWPLTLDGVHRHLEQLRGHRIVIKTLTGMTDTSLCGIWIKADELDLVFHAETSSALHRQQILLHEFSHIFFDHEHEEFKARSLGLIFPDLDPNTVVRALQRRSYPDVTEMSAELLADMLARRIRESAHRPGNPGHRFREVFG